jgi:hypothetical protein
MSPSKNVQWATIEAILCKVSREHPVLMYTELEINDAVANGE